ncbi:hypothetical protein KGD82_06250 [Nocardiopsis eucommiae]|uniref:Uncharacterized protein n=1 Tax=Nocardiopsis eucommiae TaxID=2831970 RepID=A0A975LAQ5_9ACTN|nr:hypothetical protein KGD82_06250 [Nocardiopsis eucommiae]
MKDEAPGFDRLRELRNYFSKAPVSIEEISDFVRVQTEDVNGDDVHIVSLSESEEQILHKIRARRAT